MQQQPKDKVQFKCFSCRNKVETDNYEHKINKRGRQYYSGTCNGNKKDGNPCNGRMARFFSNKPPAQPEQQHKC